MKTKLLILASALLLSTTAMATEPGKPLSSDPHGTPMPPDQAGDSDNALISGDDQTVGAKDAPKTKSSDPHPEN